MSDITEQLRTMAGTHPHWVWISEERVTVLLAAVALIEKLEEHPAAEEVGQAAVDGLKPKRGKKRPANDRP